MNQPTVGPPTRDRQADLRNRLVDQELPLERSVQELHRIARSKAPEPVGRAGAWSKLRRKR